MNQIFKVVYSAAKQCYVVTSEFAKSNGKKAAVVAAALVLTSGVGAVNAADVDSLDTRLTSLETTVSKMARKSTLMLAISLRIKRRLLPIQQKLEKLLRV